MRILSLTLLVLSITCLLATSTKTEKPVEQLSLIKAALLGLNDEVERLLNSGIDVDSADQLGQTVLHAAIQGGVTVNRKGLMN